MIQKRNIELEIILSLIKSKSHLREIARTIKESPSTILRKANELSKENIIDYNQEGRNKIFFIKNNLKAKNYIYLAEIYKLNNLLKKNPELSILFEDIKKSFSKGMIILFGSYAKGNQKKDSDIDLYLETTDNKIKNRIRQLNSRLNIKIGGFNTNSLLIKEIIKNHVIIKGVDEYYERNNFFKEV